jgi:hypothetical protein
LLIQNHCKELCALAFSGQLSGSEREELENHLALCPECRSEVGDFARIVAQMPDIAAKRNPVEVPSGLTERFLARARTEGIPLSRTMNRKKSYRVLPGRTASMAACSAATVLVVGGWVLSREFRSAGALKHHADQEVLNIHQDQSDPKPFKLEESTQDKFLQENASLKNQIKILERDLAARSAKVASDKERVTAAEAANAALQSQLAAAEAADTGLRQGISERDAQSARMRSELERAQALKDTDALAFKVEETELNSLREQVTKLDTKLRESEQLSAAANQARDLIVARHLHIVDVDDTDENGTQQRPFGRIFYTEGKKLVFYAYDLSDPRKLNAKINFYVWGSREGLNKPIKSLGIFHSDDAIAGRWVLQFDDPNVLAQINCIFVTAESPRKAVTQPTGRQLLFASLGKTINHP